MATKTEIISNAVVRTGNSPITELSDTNSKPANVGKSRYPQCRDFVLRLHHWGCAAARSTLAKDSTAPPFGFTHRYQLPPGFLKIVSVNDNCGDTYEREGEFLLANASTLNLVYTKRILEGEMSPEVAEAITMYLAYQIAKSIAGSKAQEIWQDFLVIMAMGVSADVDDTELEQAGGINWDQARFAGSGALEPKKLIIPEA